MGTFDVDDLRRFKGWLADTCITPEALDWVRGLTDEQVEEIANYLAQNGVAFKGGIPVDNDLGNRFWYLLDDAIATIEASSPGKEKELPLP